MSVRKTAKAGGARTGGEERRKVSSVPAAPDKEVIAILCSDLHLSHTPPIARSCEKDWYGVMAGYLWQLNSLASEHDAIVICAGDIFDKWNSPPELINFALANLPKMYAVPGQHDLPYHSYNDKRKSAYWTLVAAGTIVDLIPGDNLTYLVGDPAEPLCLCGFPWNFQITPVSPGDNRLKLAVIHSYCWTIGNCYVGAPPQGQLSNYYPALNGYTAALFGDNHKGFLTKIGNIPVINTGTFMCRKIDEIKYKPMVGLLYSNGSIEPRYLDTSRDKFIDPVDDGGAQDLIGMEIFIDELRNEADNTINFKEAVIQEMKNRQVSLEVRGIILDSMEK